jgi:protease-4
VFSGREALKHKLVDEIGAEAEARRWLEEKRSVPKGLKIVEWKPRRDSDFGLPRLSALIGSVIADSLVVATGQALRSDHGLGGLGLDGMISVWHPHKIEQ